MDKCGAFFWVCVCSLGCSGHAGRTGTRGVGVKGRIVGLHVGLRDNVLRQSVQTDRWTWTVFSARACLCVCVCVRVCVFLYMYPFPEVDEGAAKHEGKRDVRQCEPERGTSR